MNDTHEVSFLLIKPDGLMQPDVCTRVRHFASASEFERLDDFKVCLRDQDIAALWPQFPVETCPFMIKLMQIYLTGTTSRVMVLRGAKAIERCLALKCEIRRRYAEGSFANCLHCPSSGDELRWQLPVLWNRAHEHVPPGQPCDVGKLDGVWGRLASCSMLEIDAVARSLWDTARRNSWAGIWPTTVSQAEASVVLVNDDQHTLDFVASCVAEVLPTWSPELALAAVITMDRIGSLTLCRGDETEMIEIAERLISLQLVARRL